MSRNNHSDRIGRAITRFVENPVTNLVKGIMLLIIGLSEASKTLTDDIVHKQLRVGHGLIIIGVFGILEALPNLINSMKAGGQYLESRDEKSRARREPEVGSERCEERGP